MTTIKNKEYIYALALIVLAISSPWYSEQLMSIFETLFDIEPIANFYIDIGYSLSKIGLYSPPLVLLFNYALPFVCSLFAIYLSIKGGCNTCKEICERGFLGFIPINKWGIVPVILVILSLLTILLFWHMFALIVLD